MTLSHPEHGECYHSQSGAEAEARELYVGASGIRAFLANASGRVAILDVGLGLAYNAVLTLEAWLDAPAPPSLELVSLEVDGDLAAALATARAPWQAGWAARRLSLTARLERHAGRGWRATVPHPSGGAAASWRIVIADAATTPLPVAEGGYGYIWQDPFSPTRNPMLWSPAWFAKLRSGAAPGCRLMTYSVARGVREALAETGWTWEKLPAAQANKRHWLTAVRS